MADNRPCKAELLDWINTVSFVCDDTKLFLDTHPCNTEALEFYEEWIDTPWPWQEGGC